MKSQAIWNLSDANGHFSTLVAMMTWNYLGLRAHPWNCEAVNACNSCILFMISLLGWKVLKIHCILWRDWRAAPPEVSCIDSCLQICKGENWLLISTQYLRFSIICRQLYVCQKWDAVSGIEGSLLVEVIERQGLFPLQVTFLVYSVRVADFSFTSLALLRKATDATW